MNGQYGRKKKLRARYRLSVVFFGTVLIFGLIFYSYMKSVTLEDVLSQDRSITFFNHGSDQEGQNGGDDQNGGESSNGGVESAPVVNPVPDGERQDDSYFDDCVFIGDSITYGLSSYGVIPSSNVLASVSMSIARAETEKIDTSFGSMTVLEALGEINPKNIYIMLGSNGAAYTSPADMYQNYQAFLNKIRTACPDSELYIISAPPVTRNKENSAESPIKNADLDELNSKLLGYADANGVRYLDLNSALKDDTGCMPDNYAENDGMHFKFSTYSIFTDYILTHVAVKG